MSVPEIWRDVPRWEGYYRVSDHGRVDSLTRVVMRCNGSPLTVHGRVLRAAPSSHGYPTVRLTKPGHDEIVTVASLVLTSFVGPCPEGMECRHLDGNRDNSRLNNLAWGTREENAADKLRHGTSYLHNLSAEERNALARKASRAGMAAFSSEQRAEAARKQNAAMSPEERSAAARKASAAALKVRTREELSAAGHKGGTTRQANMTPEQRRDSVRVMNDALVHEDRVANGRKGYAAGLAKFTHDQRVAHGRKTYSRGLGSLTSEQILARNRKATATRELRRRMAKEAER